MPWTIIYYYHNEPVHLDILKKTNPQAQIIQLHTEHNLAPTEAHHNCDRVLRSNLKQKNILSQVINDNILLVEWDVYINDLIPEINLSSMMTKATSRNNINWYWWKEVTKLPNELREYATSAPLFSFIAIKKNILQEILNDKYDYIFNMQIFCELRLATIVTSLGYETETFPIELSQHIKDGGDKNDFYPLLNFLIQNPDTKGIIHPIKSKINSLSDIKI